jgi:hypothetical protein
MGYSVLTKGQRPGLLLLLSCIGFRSTDISSHVAQPSISTATQGVLVQALANCETIELGWVVVIYTATQWLLAVYMDKDVPFYCLFSKLVLSL